MFQTKNIGQKNHYSINQNKYIKKCKESYGVSESVQIIKQSNKTKKYITIMQTTTDTEHKDPLYLLITKHCLKKG